HLALGKNRAHAADGECAICPGIEISHIVDVHLESTGHGLQKTAGPSCAFVVHDKVQHSPFVRHEDALAVLAADIYQHPGAAMERLYSLGMACYLRNRCKLFLNPVTSI